MSLIVWIKCPLFMRPLWSWLYHFCNYWYCQNSVSIDHEPFTFYSFSQTSLEQMESNSNATWLILRIISMFPISIVLGKFNMAASEQILLSNYFFKHCLLRDYVWYNCYWVRMFLIWPSRKCVFYYSIEITLVM